MFSRLPTVCSVLDLKPEQSVLLEAAMLTAISLAPSVLKHDNLQTVRQHLRLDKIKA